MKRSEVAFLICVSLISIGLTTSFTASRLLRKQQTAAEAFLEQRMRDNDGAGFEKSPLLLKRVFLAAGDDEGREFSILVCAFGLIVGVVGIYFRKREAGMKLQSSLGRRQE
jgi:hypothetical protein